jgi:hypothetical protein
MAAVPMTKKQAAAAAAAVGVQITLDGERERVRRGGKRSEEAQHQAVLFARIRRLRPQYPVLRWIFATLNGMWIPGHLLARAIEAGMERGILDIWCPWRRVDPDGCVWSGLVIDLKKLKGGVPTPEQLAWASHLIENGYRVYFCAGCVDAWRCLACYLGISGRDHWAGDLQSQEDAIRQMSA